MVMHADTWFCNDQHNTTAVLNANGYFVVIDKMNHMNFSDLGMFPKQEAFKFALDKSPDFYSALYSNQSNTLGKIDGDRALYIENAYIIQFLNHYLKKEPIGWLKDPTSHFPGEVSGYFIGPTSFGLPPVWHDATCNADLHATPLKSNLRF